MLGRVVAALEGLQAAELEVATSELLEELRGANDGGSSAATLAEGLVGEVSRLPHLRATSAQRRAFARVLDAAVDAGGAQVASGEAVELLLASAGGAAKSEAVVASEAVLSLLGAGSEVAWRAVWRAEGGTAERLLEEAVQRFPGQSLPRLAEAVRAAPTLSEEWVALETLAGLGMKGELVGETEELAPAARAVMARIVRRTGAEDARAVATGLMALAGLLRSFSRAALIDDFAGVMECVERGLAWTATTTANGASINAAAVALFCQVYAALPERALSRLRSFSAQSSTNAESVRRMLATRSLPLHPALLLEQTGEQTGDATTLTTTMMSTTLEQCWSGLLMGSVMPSVVATGSIVGDRKGSSSSLSRVPDPDRWKQELEDMEEQISTLSLSLESLCCRAGLHSLPVISAISRYENPDDLLEVRAAASSARLELLFERLVRAKTVLRIHQEGLVASTHGRGASAAASETVLTSTTDHETDTSADETSGVEEGQSSLVSPGTGVNFNPVIPMTSSRQQNQNQNSQNQQHQQLHQVSAVESMTSRLKSLLASARAELAAREQSEEVLRKRLYQAEETIRVEQTAQRKMRAEAAAEVPDESLVQLSEEQEQRINELEAEVAILTEKVRDQQRYENELASLQYDIVDWEQRDVEVRAAKQDGRDTLSQLEAAKMEIHTLEETVLESQAHYHAALAEVAGLTAVTSSAMADSLRSEREIEELRKTLLKMTDAYQERIAAVKTSTPVCKSCMPDCCSS